MHGASRARCMKRVQAGLKVMTILLTVILFFTKALSYGMNEDLSRVLLQRRYVTLI